MDEKLFKLFEENTKIPDNVQMSANRAINCVKEQMKQENINSKNRIVFGKIGKTVVFASLAVVLLGTGAYAAEKYFSISDFWKKSDKTMSEPVQNMVETEIKQEKKNVVEDEFAEYKVKEALCDSDKIYIVVEAKAKGNYFLVPEDALAEDNVGNWGIDSNQSAESYASEKGLDIVHVNAGIMNLGDLDIAVQTIQWQSVSDGVIDIMIEAGKGNHNQTLDVICACTSLKMGTEDVKRSEIQFALNDISNSKREAYVPANGKMEIAGTSAVLESIDVTKTDLGTYIEIVYDTQDYLDEEALSFRLVKENGELVDGEGGAVLIEDGRMRYNLYLDEPINMEETFTLEAYNCREKEVYEQIVFTR